MMTRSTVLWALIAVAAGTGLFLMKFEIRALEERLAEVNRDILRQHEALHVLRAEWSYLNQPARLEELGRRLLRLEPLRADSTGRISDIPLRVETGAALRSTAPELPRAADPRPPLFASTKRTK